MHTKTTYSISASNRAGAYYAPGIDYDHPYGGAWYTSISAAVEAARRELAAGWHVQIIDNENGSVVEEFTTR